MRFGYVVASPTLVDAFNLMYLPWNLSLMAIAAAEAILDTGEVKDKVTYNNEWMATFVKELEAKGLKPFPPHGNYMLIDASSSGKTSAEIVQAGADMQQLFIKTIKLITARKATSRHAGHARGERALRDFRARVLLRRLKHARRPSAASALPTTGRAEAETGCRPSTKGARTRLKGSR